MTGRDASVDATTSVSRPPGVSRVALLGFGRVGRAVLELALVRPSIQVVALLARSPGRHGESAASTLAGAPAGLRVRTDVPAALRETRPEVVLMATTSRLDSVLEQLELVLASGPRVVISTAEELAFLRPEDSPEARAIHELVNASAATIVATGVNPGFVLDLWPLQLAALAWDVERIEARRVVDVSVFAPHMRTRLGIGHPPDAFEAGVRNGSITGHVGFRESLRIMCEALGRPAERVSIETKPVLAEHPCQIEDDQLEAGTSVAVSQHAVAWRDGKAWIEIELLLHAAPRQAGVRIIDEVWIFGRHELHATLEPGASAILSTAAQLVNAIPRATTAAPGIYAPGSLPPSVPWLAMAPAD